MAQDTVSKVLKLYYPEYLSFNELRNKVNLSKGSLYKNLKGLEKRNEVEVIIILGKWNHKPKALYRINGGDKQNE